MRVLGVDPGTGSMDLLAIEDESGEIIYAASIERQRVTRDPSIVYELVENLHSRYGFQAMTAPSGYGISLKRVQDATIEEICEASFTHCRDLEEQHQIHGLRTLMILYHESSLPAYFTPGAIHLPTIPEYRKLGRIDLGTADKIYTVAAALAILWEKHGVQPEDANAIIVEAGKAYTSGLLVEKGGIRDGIGGTMGWWGLEGGGLMDAETCYVLSTLRPQMPKRYLFRGGVNYAPRGSRPRMAGEAVAKTIATLLAAADESVEWIVLSGRTTILYRDEVSSRVEKLVSRLHHRPRIVLLEDESPKGVKAGAYGAAVVASGVAGGKYSRITSSLRLGESRGSIFDYLKPWGLESEAKLYFRHCPPREDSS